LLARILVTLVAVAISAFALWLSTDVEIVATDSALDDELFLRKAETTVWFGNEPYSKFILFKEPTYPLFAAIWYRLGIPLRMGHELFYLFAGGCLACALTYRQSRAWVGLCVYAAIALYPIHFTIFQRAGHGGFYISLMVLTPAALLWQYKRINTPGRWRRWLLSGIIIGLIWNTRQEKPLAILLILPFLIAGYAALRRLGTTRWRLIRDWSLEWIPPLGLAAVITIGLSAANYARFGVFAISDVQAPNFRAAYKSLLSITPDRPIPFVPVTRDMREKAYAVSPTFRQLATYLEAEPAKISTIWSHFQDVPPNEFSGGWFVTSFRDAVASIGQYKSGKDTEAFYGQMTKELRDAADDGRLPTHWLPPGASWVLHPYPETYLGNVIPSWRALWFHAWSDVWQAGPAPLNDWATPEVRALFDRVANRREVSPEDSEWRNHFRYWMWVGFTKVSELVLASSFLIAGIVLVLHRRVPRWGEYLLPAIAFGSYGFAAFVVFTIIEASTIPTRDYLFPAILSLVITAVWLLAEGIRLIVKVFRTASNERPGERARHRVLATTLAAASIGFSFLLFAQWGYGRLHPQDPVEEVGRFLVVDSEKISGWARHRNQPEPPVEVEIYVDGRLLAKVRADQPHKDLIAAHIGTGRHAFQIPTPPELRDGKEHTIEAKVAGTNYRLADSPMVVTLPSAAADNKP
jgi:hypothetical protein